MVDVSVRQIRFELLIGLAPREVTRAPVVHFPSMQQGDGPLGIRGREEDGQRRSSRPPTEEGGTFHTGRVHHRAHVVHAGLEGRADA